MIAALGAGCTEAPPADPATQVVASVGETAITVADYDRMAATLLKTSHRGRDPSDLQTRRDLLEAMIARELLLLEGQRRGLADSTRIAGELEQMERRLLWRALFDEVAAGAGVDDEEGLQEFVAEAGFDEEVLLQHVMLRSEEAARDVLAALERGEPMEVLAAERSIHHDTGRVGGYFNYMPVAYVLPELREQLLSLEPGQTYPEPLKSRYGIHVFRLVDRRPADIDSRRELIERAFRVHARTVAFDTFADSLAAARGLTCRELSPTGGGVLCSWEGGQLTAAQADLAPGESGPGAQDRWRREARDRLVAEEARRRGLDQVEGIRRQLDIRRQALVVDSLRRAVVGTVEVSEEDRRRFYDEHPELYGPRPTVRVEEILVEDRTLAQRLRGQAEAGAAIDSLARKHSIREATRSRSGSMWLTTRDNALLGQLAPTALDAVEGSLHGPLEVPGGYSVFRVAERRRLPARPYEAVRRNIEAVLRLRAEHERMDSLLTRLRLEFAHVIDIRPDALESVLAAPREDAAARVETADEVESGNDWH